VRGRICLALLLLAGCRTTVDSLGYNGSGGIVLHPITGPAMYPNAFGDLLNKSDSDISTKINATFMQLFHGDAGTQAIYFPVGTDQAYIQDILHGDVRTEGIGYGMLIAVELDKRDEHDRLWTYAKNTLQITSGAAAGYFNSFCEAADATWAPCPDPFGLEQFVMALLFANDRWGSTTGAIDYGSDVKTLLTLMRHKQDQNGGVVDGVTDVFDGATGLPYDVPDVSSANQTRPSVLMPAYYDLWAQATGDPFWTRAAGAARTHFQRVADPATGLMPERARFDGTPLSGWDVFAPQTYRAQLNMVLDSVWSGSDPWEVAEANNMLQFFAGRGLDSYGDVYTLDGKTMLDAMHDPGLVSMNGASALIATTPERMSFVSAVWSLATPSGQGRYYAGLLNLLSLIVLGGQFKVY
jgi:oligosaccharide reducing-end xylanase